MMWYLQHRLLLRATYFFVGSFFISVGILLKLTWRAKTTTIEFKMILHDGREYYPVQKLKKLENGRAESEMKRESNLGTGWWFRIQWIEAMLVWTASCTTRGNQFKSITCIFETELGYCFWRRSGIQTSIALDTGRTKEGILTLGPTTTSHPGQTGPTPPAMST